jgi:hypothetical protein
MMVMSAHDVAGEVDAVDCPLKARMVKAGHSAQTRRRVAVPVAIDRAVNRGNTRVAALRLHGLSETRRNEGGHRSYICRKRWENARLTINISGRDLSLMVIRPDSSRVVAAT